MQRKPVFDLAVVGGDIKQKKFIELCLKHPLAARPTNEVVHSISLESNERIYRIHECDLACGSLSAIPFFENAYPIGMVWLVSRNQKEFSRTFMGHPDEWLFFIARQLNLSPVVFWMAAPTDESTADEEENRLREMISTTGFAGDSITFLRVHDFQRTDKKVEILRKLFDVIDSFPVPPPYYKKPTVISQCRAMVFLQKEERGILPANQPIQISIVKTGRLTPIYKTARMLSEQTLSAGQFGIVSLTLDTPSKEKPGQHFNFTLPSKKAKKSLSRIESFGYMLITE